MKRLSALVLVFICLISSASANPWELLSTRYNAAASTFGAQELKREQVKLASVDSKDDTLYINYNTYDLFFTFDEKDQIKTAMIRLLDDSGSYDFLLACVCVISTLGKIDVKAFGVALTQMANAKTGKEATDVFNVGLDIFAIQKSNNNESICFFTYLNNDLSYR